VQDFDFQTAFDRVHERMNDIHQETTETRTKLEVLVGNGQPGKIQGIEAELKDIALWRAKVIGYVAAISGGMALAGFALHFAFELLKH
jgi:hypothetical protein